MFGKQENYWVEWRGYEWAGWYIRDYEGMLRDARNLKIKREIIITLKTIENELLLLNLYSNMRLN